MYIKGALLVSLASISPAFSQTMAYDDQPPTLTETAMNQNNQSIADLSRKIILWKQHLSRTQSLPALNNGLPEDFKPLNRALTSQSTLRPTGNHSTLRQASWIQPLNTEPTLPAPTLPVPNPLQRTDTLILPETIAEEQARARAEAVQEAGDHTQLLTPQDIEDFIRTENAIDGLRRILEEVLMLPPAGPDVPAAESVLVVCTAETYFR